MDEIIIGIVFFTALGIFIGWVSRMYYSKNKSSNELEGLLINLIKEGNYKEFAEAQSKSMQEHNYRLKEIERQNMIKEKYEYLKFRKDNGLEITDEDQREYDYVSFFIKGKEGFDA